MLGLLLLAPTLTQPPIALALVVAVVAVLLAIRSPVYPLALAGIPALITAIIGTNPLPKGGATLLVGGWVVLGVAVAVMRGSHAEATRGLTTLPVFMALLIVGLMALRLSGSPDPGYGSQKLQLVVADNLVFLLAGIFVGSRPKDLRIFFLIMLAVVVSGALLLVFELLAGGAQQQYSGRFTLSQQQGSINLGRASANGALIAAGLGLLARSSTVRLGSVAVLPILIVSLLAAGSRGPTVAFVVALVTLLTLIAATGRRRRQLLLIVGALVVAAVMVPVVVPSSSIGRSLSAIFGGSGGLSTNGRSSLWGKAFAAFAAHPVGGIGTGGFAATVPVEQFPHNLLLEMALELGIVGLLAVVTMLVSMLRRLMRVWRATGGETRLQAALLIALFVQALVNAMFSGAVQDNYDLWLWGGLGIGMLAFHRRAAGLKARRAAASS